jgi:hypothetical protein
MFQCLNVLGVVVEDTVSGFLGKVMQVSASRFGRVFGIEGMQETGLHSVPVFQLSLSFWNTSRLSHQDRAFHLRMLANSRLFLLSSQVAISGAISTLSMSLRPVVVSMV